MNSIGKTDQRDCPKRLLKPSSLYRLDPFLDLETGVLRVGGRIKHARIPTHMKHPVVLPSKHHITTLIIRHIHEANGHIGRYHTLSILRENYWVVNANSTVRTVLSRCVTCKKSKASTVEQKMADLPEERVTPMPPFTFSGVDYFGPFTIKEKRSMLKRYGIIFTCFASRAIHLETANNLETGTFIQALRRFIARRGTVQELRSDNGTNFRGADNELRKALNEMNQSEISRYLLRQNITWKFNPPSASHMGGVWERHIRSVRSVLSNLLKEFGERLDDESFRTLMCEVEAIVNSRPLTWTSSDVNDPQPLSPDSNSENQYSLPTTRKFPEGRRLFA